jgi:hypothetical protein
MLHEEVKYFLNQNQIRHISFEKDAPFSPFDYLYLPDIHLIDLKVVGNLQLPTQQLPKFEISGLKCLFEELSDYFNAQNLKIIHLWEDIWHKKKSICQSRILAMCGIFERVPARLTRVQRIDKPTADKFLNENHLQVSTTAKFKYGLFLPERYFRVIKNQQDLIHDRPLLVAVATFSNAKTIIRESKESRSYELIRFANLQGMTVVGGLDKLLKAFINEHSPDDIMTYADRDWSDGKSYEKLGFQRIKNTTPQGFWLDENLSIRYYENKLNEHEKIGLKPVFNAGNIKFIKFLSTR